MVRGVFLSPKESNGRNRYWKLSHPRSKVEKRGEGRRLLSNFGREIMSG